MSRVFPLDKRISTTLSMVCLLGVVGCSPSVDPESNNLLLDPTAFQGLEGPSFPLESSIAGFAKQPLDILEMAASGKQSSGLTVHHYTLETNDLGQVKVVIEETNGFSGLGEPDVPVITELIKMPAGQDFEIQNLELDSESISLKEIASRGDLRKSDVFQEDQFFPPEPIQFDYAWQGTQRYARVAYHPVQVNPVTGEGLVHRSIRANINLVPTPEKQALEFQVASLSSAQPSSIAGQPVCVLDAGLLLPPMNGNPGDFAPRRAGAEVDAIWTFELSETAFYRLQHSEMVAAGMDTNALVGSQFRLFCRTNEVALTVSTDGSFGPGDFIEFLGIAYDGYYSTNQVYWLGFGSGGLRMTDRSAPFTDVGTPITRYIEREVVDDHVIYRSAYEPSRDFDHWFMSLPVTEATSLNYSFSTPQRIAGQTANLTYSLHQLEQGGTSLHPKDTRLLWGGNQVAQLLSTGQAWVTGTVSFSSSFISDGTSSITVDQVPVSGPPAGCYAESFTLDYPRAIRVINEQLCFALPAGTNEVHVDGFSDSSGIRIYDVTDPWKPERLLGVGTDLSPNGVKLKFGEDRSTNTSYYAFRGPAIKFVTNVEPVMFRNLADTNRVADYILITPYEFREQAYRLLKRRSLETLNVAVAPIEDIYNEFSYGVRDVNAIKQFLGYAFHHWSGPAPKYVLLAGKGTVDPLDLQGFGVIDYIPVLMGPTLRRYTAKENELVMVNGGDFLADMTIGRMPVSSEGELKNVVDKIFGFEDGEPWRGWRNELLLVADNSEPGLPFKADSENTIRVNAVAGGLTNVGQITTAYLDDVDAGTVFNIIGFLLNNDVGWITYMGHGDLDQWAAENVWSASDIALTTNQTTWPIVGVFSCANGIFQDPELGDPCLAEEFITHSGKGASGVFAPSALSDQGASEKLAEGFSRSMLKDDDYRFGDGVREALLELWGTFPGVDELSTYQIFGDPGQVVNP